MTNTLPGHRFKNQADASRKCDFYAQKSHKSAENLSLASMVNDRAFTGFALKVGAEICRNLPARNQACREASFWSYKSVKSPNMTSKMS